MNLKQLKNNVGHRVQLAPCACRLNAHGLPLPEVSDDWLIESVTEEQVRLIDVTTGHNLVLGNDQIHHFTSDPQRSRSSIKYGFLTLVVQPFIQGNEVWIKPTIRPGEPLPPPAVVISDKFVHFTYPTESGLQKGFERLGFKVAWSRE